LSQNVTTKLFCSVVDITSRETIAIEMYRYFKTVVKDCPAVSAILSFSNIKMAYMILYNHAKNIADAENVEPVQEKVEKKYMEFDDFLNGRFRASSFYPHWVSGRISN